MIITTTAMNLADIDAQGITITDADHGRVSPLTIDTVIDDGETVRVAWAANNTRRTSVWEDYDPYADVRIKVSATPRDIDYTTA